jgi:hypothetical protein
VGATAPENQSWDLVAAPSIRSKGSVERPAAWVAAGGTGRQKDRGRGQRRWGKLLLLNFWIHKPPISYIRKLANMESFCWATSPANLQLCD